MQGLNQLKVSTRLGLSFGIVLALVMGLGAFALWRLSQINQSSQDISANWLPSSIAVSAINTRASDLRISELQHLLSRSPQEMDKYEAEMRDNVAQMKRQSEAYETLISSPDEKAQWQNFMRLWDLYLIENKKFVRLSHDNKDEEALDLFRGPSEKLFTEGTGQLQKLVDLNTLGGKGATAAANALYDSTIQVLLVVIGLVTGVSLAAGVAITRSITRQLGGEPGYAVQVANQIASGDLSQTVRLRSGDRDSIAAALESMRTHLAEVVGEVRNSSESIATGSQQIASGTADLSHRTEEQASSLEQTAAAMEQLTSTVQSNAETAKEADRQARDASAAARDGGKKVGSVVATMDDIAHSSKKIVDIIGVIDGIAFQTNILALNAAVEAARAGEQGRGFAVVASEVRSLAHRSAEAAKEIKILIGASVQKVEVGTKLVNDAGAAMHDIVTQVTNVSNLINEISNATTEQTSGIGQVSTSVTQMDNVTQQNAALVEQSAAAADNLRTQASRLAQVVGTFRLAHQAPSMVLLENA